MHTLTATLPGPDSFKQSRFSAKTLRRLLGRGSEFELHTADSSERVGIEQYIHRCFAKTYQADVTEFAPLLLSLRCAGSLSGAVGIRTADSSPLFAEAYLDRPLEQIASDISGSSIDRDELVEIGNMAAMRPGSGQLLNIILVAVMHGAGIRYAGFACTDILQKILRKQHFVFHSVATANPERLGDSAAQWGSYYDTDPSVILVDVPATLDELRSQYLSGAVLRFFKAEINSLIEAFSAWRAASSATSY